MKWLTKKYSEDAEIARMIAANESCSNCEHAKTHPARLFSCECGTKFTAPVQKDTATCFDCLKPAPVHF